MAAVASGNEYTHIVSNYQYYHLTRIYGRVNLMRHAVRTPTWSCFVLCVRIRVSVYVYGNRCWCIRIDKGCWGASASYCAPDSVPTPYCIRQVVAHIISLSTSRTHFSILFFLLLLFFTQQVSFLVYFL